MASRLPRRAHDRETARRPLWTTPGPTRMWTPGGPCPDASDACARASPTMTSVATRTTAAFFDLDKTIIAKSSSLAFSKPFQAGG